MARTALVVGGGVAGLEAARQLASAGRRVLVLEAGDRVGGAVRSESLAGVVVDVGAEAYGVARPETRDLIDELGLADQIVAPRRSDARLLLDDGLHAMPHAMLGIPTDLDSTEVLAILGADEARRARERDAAPVAAVDQGISLGALVRARMGEGVAERILTPVVAGVHAADPDLVEAEAVIPGLLASLEEAGSLAAAAGRLRSAPGIPGSAVAGLRGGMTTLVRALEQAARARGARIRTDAPVRGVRREGAIWRVEGAWGAVEADELVLAIDAPGAAALLAASPGVASALARVMVGDVVVCAAVIASSELDDDPVGSGLLVAPGHPAVRAKALTHATAKWDWIRESYGPGRHLVRLSYGRDGRIDERLADLPGIARADVAAVFGIPEPVLLDLRVARWDRSLVLPRPGHREALAELQGALSHEPALAVVGAGLGGNGLAGTIARGRDVLGQLNRG